MNDLEHGYRKAIRWYPRRWRAEHEEALLGILLDRADEEGRARMSSADRRDLVHRGLRLRLNPVLIAVLLTIGSLAVLGLASSLIGGAGLDDQLLFVPPPLHPVPIGSGWVPLFIITLPRWAWLLTCASIALGAATGAGVLIRESRENRQRLPSGTPPT